MQHCNRRIPHIQPSVQAAMIYPKSVDAKRLNTAEQLRAEQAFCSQPATKYSSYERRNVWPERFCIPFTYNTRQHPRDSPEQWSRVTLSFSCSPKIQWLGDLWQTIHTGGMVQLPGHWQMQVHTPGAVCFPSPDRPAHSSSIQQGGFH